MADPVIEFELYRQELLAALGADDPVDVLRTTLAEVERIVGGASVEALSHQPEPGEWSPREVFSHLADSDLVTGMRVRMVVTQDRPVLVGYDQEAWASRFGDLDADARETIERWQALRRANIRAYESLSEQEWQRVGAHTERGDESVLLTVRLQAGHDRVHLDQVRRGLASAAATV
jgi:DinB superfamily